MARKIFLLTIDAQNDFCDSNGALFVKGADEDTKRLVKLVNKFGDKIDLISATLDSHQETHIAHPLSWVDKSGNHPNPFTLITADDLDKGNWRAFNPRRQNWFEKYVKTLDKNKRYILCIWPGHCIIGSWGHSLVPAFSEACREWSRKKNHWVNYVTKGSNDDTEHYSAVQADVQIDSDPTTKLNTRLIDMLKIADDILITGQALSHCVANTITDVANNFGDAEIKKFVLLEDCCSNVPSFESFGEKFVKELGNRGMRISTSKDVLA